MGVFSLERQMVIFFVKGIHQSGWFRAARPIRLILLSQLAKWTQITIYEEMNGHELYQGVFGSAFRFSLLTYRVLQTQISHFEVFGIASGISAYRVFQKPKRRFGEVNPELLIAFQLIVTVELPRVSPCHHRFELRFVRFLGFHMDFSPI